MLVLTRRLAETVVIDGNIRITVVALEGKKVRLGIAAPDSVRVDRQEVHERIAQFTADLDETSHLGNRAAPRNGADWHAS